MSGFSSSPQCGASASVEISAQHPPPLSSLPLPHFSASSLFCEHTQHTHTLSLLLFQLSSSHTLCPHLHCTSCRIPFLNLSLLLVLLGIILLLWSVISSLFCFGAFFPFSLCSPHSLLSFLAVWMGFESHCDHCLSVVFFFSFFQGHHSTIHLPASHPPCLPSPALWKWENHSLESARWHLSGGGVTSVNCVTL